MLAEGAKAMMLQPDGLLSESSGLALIAILDPFKVRISAVVLVGSLIYVIG